MVEPVVVAHVVLDVDHGFVLVDIVQDHDVDADFVVDYVVTDVVDKTDNDVFLCVLFLLDVVVEFLLADVLYDDVVDAVVYSPLVDLLIVLHDDQLVSDELLMLILDINLFDARLLLYLFDAAVVVLAFFLNDVFDVLCFVFILFAGHVDALDACCISML